MDLLKARPKLKKAYPVVYKDGSVYIGGVGEIIEYEDPSGAIEYMLKKMDGINTVEKIIREVSETYSELSPSDVMEAIDEISKERFIEDLNLTGSKILSKYELERYHRNINFFSSYATLSENKYISQKKLIDSKIGIIGLGGLGSHIIYDLAGLGIGEIKAVEGVGAILGAILAPELIKKFRYGKILSISTMLAGLSTMLLSINTNYIYIYIYIWEYF